MDPADFIAFVPQARELGIRLESYDAYTGRCVMRLPFREELIGDPARGFVHGGVMTTLLDTLGGATAIARGIKVRATLDLRIDYLRPAVRGADLLAYAECYRVTRHVAFVRGSCHQGDLQRPVAELTATFVLAHTDSKGVAEEMS
jgi:uncharacterized protein (TIGR00369 family)